MSRSNFKITNEPIDIAILNQTLRDDSAGAYASFEGLIAAGDTQYGQSSIASGFGGGQTLFNGRYQEMGYFPKV